MEGNSGTSCNMEGKINGILYCPQVNVQNIFVYEYIFIHMIIK